MAVTWDPAQYQHHAGLRNRPFFDLTARIGAAAPAIVCDLGCGPGNLTAALADRWPDARVIGVDSSPAMIDEAIALGSRVEFVQQDIAEFSPPPGLDVLVSNAALQWVPEHPRLLPGWLTAMSTGAWVAIQVPDMADEPSHRILRELAASPAWASRIGDALGQGLRVQSPGAYAELLLAAGWQADVWQTTYLQLLTMPDPVVDWMRGTSMRPVLDVLAAADAEEFQAEYAVLMRKAYPPGPFGTLFPFRRTFVVGRRS